MNALGVASVFPQKSPNSDKQSTTQGCPLLIKQKQQSV